MPLCLHLALHLLFGTLLAWVSREVPQARARLLAWPLLGALLYDAAVGVPCVAYSMRFYPAHALSYAFDPLLQPGLYAHLQAWSLLAALSNLLLLVFAYATGRAMLAAGRPLLLLLPGSVAMAAIVATTAATERTFWLSDYTGFWQGHASAWTLHVHAWLSMAAYSGALLLLRHVQRNLSQRDAPLLAFFC